MRCCFQDLSNIACSILVQFPSNFFSITKSASMRCICIVEVIQTAAWKKLHFILSDRSDFYMIDKLSIAVHAFVRCILMAFSVDETLLPLVHLFEWSCLFLD